MKQVTSCLLNAFRTSPLLPEPLPLFPNEAAIHTTAIAKLAQDTCTLQHHALNFVSAILAAEPATLKHLRAEGLWDLAYGHLFFFWGGTDDGAHRHQGEDRLFLEGFLSLHTVHMVATQLACGMLFVFSACTKILRRCGKKACWLQACTATWHASE